MKQAESTVKELLKHADIKVGGTRPQDITIRDERTYARVLRQRELGLGESYMDGWWDCKRIDQMVAQALSADLRSKIKLRPGIVLAGLSSIIFNQQTIRRAGKNAAHHYNIGNDLYERMLGERMVYSCAYWRDAKTLDEAQEQKLDLICRKLHLKRGMTVLDIGCGWGGFAEYAASKYGAIVTGISPAIDQVRMARVRTKHLGARVKILQRDYRQMTGKFDRVISVGMLEHVGPRNYPKFFEICRQLLKDDGIMLHHTIGGNSPGRNTNAWMNKYIFPGGVIPSLSQITAVVERQLIIEDVQNIGPDYDKTLMAWHRNFVRHYGEIKDNYDERFYRMWTFYLQICAGAFRSRQLQLWQIVMRKIEPAETYVAAR